MNIGGLNNILPNTPLSRTPSGNTTSDMEVMEMEEKSSESSSIDEEKLFVDSFRFTWEKSSGTSEKISVGESSNKKAAEYFAKNWGEHCKSEKDIVRAYEWLLSFETLDGSIGTALNEMRKNPYYFKHLENGIPLQEAKINQILTEKQIYFRHIDSIGNTQKSHGNKIILITNQPTHIALAELIKLMESTEFLVTGKLPKPTSAEDIQNILRNVPKSVTTKGGLINYLDGVFQQKFNTSLRGKDIEAEPFKSFWEDFKKQKDREIDIFITKWNQENPRHLISDKSVTSSEKAPKRPRSTSDKLKEFIYQPNKKQKLNDSRPKSTYTSRQKAHLALLPFYSSDDIEQALNRIEQRKEKITLNTVETEIEKIKQEQSEKIKSVNNLYQKYVKNLENLIVKTKIPDPRKIKESLKKSSGSKKTRQKNKKTINKFKKKFNKVFGTPLTKTRYTELKKRILTEPKLIFEYLYLNEIYGRSSNLPSLENQKNLRPLKRKASVSPDRDRPIKLRPVLNSKPQPIMRPPGKEKTDTVSPTEESGKTHKNDYFKEMQIALRKDGFTDQEIKIGFKEARKLSSGLPSIESVKACAEEARHNIRMIHDLIEEGFHPDLVIKAFKQCRTDTPFPQFDIIKQELVKLIRQETYEDIKKWDLPTAYFELAWNEALENIKLEIHNLDSRDVGKIIQDLKGYFDYLSVMLDNYSSQDIHNAYLTYLALPESSDKRPKPGVIGELIQQNNKERILGDLLSNGYDPKDIQYAYFHVESHNRGKLPSVDQVKELLDYTLSEKTEKIELDIPTTDLGKLPDYRPENEQLLSTKILEGLLTQREMTQPGIDSQTLQKEWMKNEKLPENLLKEYKKRGQIVRKQLKFYTSKTIAVTDEGTFVVSGAKSLGRTTLVIPPDTKKIEELNKIIGHHPRTHNLDTKSFLNTRFFNTHSERTALMMSTNVGVSKAMCHDCQEFAKRLAIDRQRDYVVCDPETDRIFRPIEKREFWGRVDVWENPRGNTEEKTVSHNICFKNGITVFQKQGDSSIWIKAPNGEMISITKGTFAKEPKDRYIIFSYNRLLNGGDTLTRKDNKKHGPDTIGGFGGIYALENLSITINETSISIRDNENNVITIDNIVLGTENTIKDSSVKSNNDKEPSNSRGLNEGEIPKKTPPKITISTTVPHSFNFGFIEKNEPLRHPPKSTFSESEIEKLREFFTEGGRSSTLAEHKIKLLSLAKQLTSVNKDEMIAPSNNALQTKWNNLKMDLKNKFLDAQSLLTLQSLLKSGQITSFGELNEEIENEQNRTRARKEKSGLKEHHKELSEHGGKKITVPEDIHQLKQFDGTVSDCTIEPIEQNGNCGFNSINTIKRRGNIILSNTLCKITLNANDEINRDGFLKLVNDIVDFIKKNPNALSDKNLSTAIGWLETLINSDLGHNENSTDYLPINTILENWETHGNNWLTTFKDRGTTWFSTEHMEFLSNLFGLRFVVLKVQKEGDDLILNSEYLIEPEDIPEHNDIPTFYMVNYSPQEPLNESFRTHWEPCFLG